MTDTRDKELAEKEVALTAEIELLLPDFARSCRDSADVVIIHQDSFADDYQDEEYALFGIALKFAGLRRKRSPGHRKEQRDAHCGESCVCTIVFPQTILREPASHWGKHFLPYADSISSPVVFKAVYLHKTAPCDKALTALI